MPTCARGRTDRPCPGPARSGPAKRRVPHLAVAPSHSSRVPAWRAAAWVSRTRPGPGQACARPPMLTPRADPKSLGREFRYLAWPMFVMGNFLCGVPCRDSHGSAHNGTGSATAAEHMSQHIRVTMPGHTMRRAGPRARESVVTLRSLASIRAPCYPNSTLIDRTDPLGSSRGRC
jgi:hypothetical protein